VDKNAEGFSKITKTGRTAEATQAARLAPQILGAMAQTPKKSDPPTTYIAPKPCAKWRNGAAV
jgi:hypothetical protein